MASRYGVSRMRNTVRGISVPGPRYLGYRRIGTPADPYEALTNGEDRALFDNGSSRCGLAVRCFQSIR
jgi:hypothetical protein